MNLHTIQRFDPGTKEEAFMEPARRVIYFACACILVFGAICAPAQEPSKTAAAQPQPESSTAKTAGQPAQPQRIVEQGIAIEFTIDPQKGKLPKPREIGRAHV